MSGPESARELVERWRAGDPTAADELHRRYAQRLCRLAEGQIGQRLGRRVGPDDVVQSVFRTFFRRTAEGQYPIDHSGALWHLLVRIALNKVRGQGAHHRAARRNIDAEEYLHDDQVIPASLLHDPSPEEVVALLDELDAVMAGFDQSEGEMLRLTLEGHSTSEIADRTGCSRHTVRRVLNRIGHLLRGRLDRNSQ